MTAMIDALTEALTALEKHPESEVLALLSKPDADLAALHSELVVEVSQVTDELLQTYLPNPTELVNMYKEAEALDATLGSMEQELGSFLSGLHSVSDSLHQLQFRSHEINAQLKDKRQILDSLTTYVESVIIDPGLIRGIAEVSSFSAATIPRLNELSSKLFAAQRRGAATDPQTVVLEKLRLRAVLKSKELLCGSFEDLKAAAVGNFKPAQLTKIRGEISKLQPFLVFLHQHASDAYEEVLAYYVGVAGKITWNIVKNFLAGHPKPGILGIFEAIAAPATNSSGPSVGSAGLCIGGREALIGEVKAAVKSQGEVPDRAVESFEEHVFQQQMCIANAATTEYAFLCSFFPAGHTDIFSQVFGKVMSSTQEEFTKDVNLSSDSISLLLVVHALEGAKEVLSGRGVPCLRTYHERMLNVTLWPRIRSLFDLHIQSLKQASVKQLLTQSLQPHYVTRRYAELLSSALVLKKTTWGEATGFHSCLRELTGAFDALLGQVAKKIGSGVQDETVFLLNNWDCIVAVLTQNLRASEETLISKYGDKVKEGTDVFVEVQLTQRFSQLLTFVGDAEAKLAKGEDSASLKDSAVATVNSWFRNNWKFEIEKIKTYVNSNFSNMNNGLEILKNILTQLLLYYTRFQKILTRKYGSTLPPNIAKDQVLIQDIMAETKSLPSF